jgi:aldose 1-epimerase
MDDTTILRLEHGDASVEISPRLGGTILRFTWRGMPMLRPSDGVPAIPRFAACYPLLPFSNRIADGRLSFGGKDYAIPRTVDYEPLPIHGLAWQRPWHVAKRTADHAILVQAYTPEGQPPAWPFPYAAEQTFKLNEDGLHLTLSMRNTGSVPQPAGLGWHPYFPRTPGAFVRAGVAQMWVNDDRHLPLRLEAAPAILAAGMPVENTDYDNVFRGFRGNACVAWPERDAAVTLHAYGSISHLVIFTPPGKPHLAVEPVSHMTDAFNRYSAAGGPASPGHDDKTGTTVLAPGALLKAAISLRPATLGDAEQHFQALESAQ